MNRKGFMMAEVVVVSAIVLMTLTALYVSYNKIYTTYQKRINYYDITSLYKLGFYRDMLFNNIDENNELLINSILEKKMNKLDVLEYLKQYVEIETIDNYKTTDTVYLIKDPIENINDNALKDISSITFKEYIKYLKDAVKIDSNYLMTMERCFYVKDKNGNETSEVDRDNCKYAYLELYDGYEVS